ncbi:unnamed protein product [Coregonus sp. 'balchen']|nr:unnamed protein product [Coregonus sp. 'balchen']
MELFRTAIVLPVLVLSQALLNTVYSVPRNFSGSGETDEQQTSNLTISNPPRLSQHCSGVVEVLHQGLWRPVTFDLGSAEWAKVAEDICANLSCGAVYELRQNGTATLNYSSSTCLSQCVYRDLLGTRPCDWLEANTTVRDGWSCGDRKNGERCVTIVGNLSDGGVVCAQLGCGSALNVSGQGGSFGAGVGQVLLDEVNCGGSERNLWECPSLGTANDCGHKEDAAVVCSGIPSQSGNETAEQNTQTSTEAGSVLLVTSAESWSSPPTAAVWGCIALSIALLLTIISNALLFLSYRRRAAPQYLSQRPSQNDTDTACDSDYENYDFSDQPSVAMATALVHSLLSSSTSSGECYENIETLEKELLGSGPDLREAALTDLICRREPSLGSSSSTSSGESYENVGMAVEQHLQEHLYTFRCAINQYTPGSATACDQ